MKIFIGNKDDLYFSWNCYLSLVGVQNFHRCIFNTEILAISSVFWMFMSKTTTQKAKRWEWSMSGNLAGNLSTFIVALFLLYHKNFMEKKVLWINTGCINVFQENIWKSSLRFKFWINIFSTTEYSVLSPGINKLKIFLWIQKNLEITNF